MGETIERTQAQLDAAGIRYHATQQDSCLSLFLDNVNTAHGVHFDVVQMYFDHGRLAMVSYTSLRSVDAKTDWQVLQEDLNKEFTMRETTTRVLQAQRGSLKIRAERLTAYPGLYLTYTDTLYIHP